MLRECKELRQTELRLMRLPSFVRHSGEVATKPANEYSKDAPVWWQLLQGRKDDGSLVGAQLPPLGTGDSVSCVSMGGRTITLPGRLRPFKAGSAADLIAPEVAGSASPNRATYPFGMSYVTRLGLLLKKWGVYCEALFKELALEAPSELVRLTQDGGLPPEKLTFAAEALGAVDSETGIDALESLLVHPSPLVREGAVLGLATYVNAGHVRATALAKAAARDSSPGVRATARDVLDADL